MSAVKLSALAKQPSADSVSLDSLSDEAAKAVRDVIDGEQLVMVTGGAGSGKSTLIRWMQRHLHKRLAIVAPTGIAALNAGGMTIHSFFRFKPDLRDASQIRSRSDDLIQKLELLIIDEISMVRADMIDLMDAALRMWRRDRRPFGGLQILFVGDLCQLPPVLTSNEAELFFARYPSPWFFDSEVLQSAPVKVHLLSKIYRQSDQHFASLLNRIRLNADHRDAVGEINRRCFRDVDSRSADLTLTMTNAVADRINSTELTRLDPKTERTYLATKEGSFTRATDARLPAPERLVLRMGAQVIVTRNCDGAVNGTIGTVLALHKDRVVIQTKDGEKLTIEAQSWEQFAYASAAGGGITSEAVGKYTQIPLLLGWAITVHRSQGLTLDSVLVDFGDGAFACGQAYVALSRCRAIETMRLARPMRMGDVCADPSILNFYQNLAARQAAA